MFCIFCSAIGSFVLRWYAPSIGWRLSNLLVFLAGAWVGTDTMLLVWMYTGEPTLLALFWTIASFGTAGGLLALAAKSSAMKRFARR